MCLTDLSATALSAAIRSKAVSCREVMQATLARIEAVNPVHNALASLRDAEVLLRDAELAGGSPLLRECVPRCQRVNGAAHEGRRLHRHRQEQHA